MFSTDITVHIQLCPHNTVHLGHLCSKKPIAHNIAALKIGQLEHVKRKCCFVSLYFDEEELGLVPVGIFKH